MSHTVPFFNVGQNYVKRCPTLCLSLIWDKTMSSYVPYYVFHYVGQNYVKLCPILCLSFIWGNSMSNCVPYCLSLMLDQTVSSYVLYCVFCWYGIKLFQVMHVPDYTTVPSMWVKSASVCYVPGYVFHWCGTLISNYIQDYVLRWCRTKLSQTIFQTMSFADRGQTISNYF